MRPLGCLLLAVAIAPLMNSCEIAAGVAEFCSQETIEVTTTADVRRPCDAGECSLWGAIDAANVCNSGMTVLVPERSRFSIGEPSPEAGRSPPQTIFPAISGVLSIEGRGAEVVRSSAGVPPERFFVVNPRGNLTISNLSLRSGGGHDGPSGGAILNRGGTVVLEDVELRGNESNVIGGAIDNRGQLTVNGGRYLANLTSGCDEAGGGAIYNSSTGVIRIEGAEFRQNTGCGGAILNNGRVTVIDSVFAANHGSRARYADSANTYYVGGAIFNEGTGGRSVVTIEGSTFLENRALVGAAIANSEGNQLTIRRSTLSRNVAYVPCRTCDPPTSPGSPAIHNYGDLLLEDVTITANECDELFRQCGALVLQSFSTAASASVSNSIIAGNPDGDCTTRGAVSFDSRTVNLDSDGSCPGFGLHTSPRLGPLRDNGGPTPTHAVLPNSPALNAGTRCLEFDQRGQPRARSSDDPCDLGAYELR